MRKQPAKRIMEMLDWALRYHNEGLDVIPVKPRDKAVALPSWEEYQTRMSTVDEIKAWWTAMPTANVGIIHGLNGYICLDFDKDSGIYAQLRGDFPDLFGGRIEQTGSGNGYHVPLFLDELPEFGWDNSKCRPKGNRTYRTTGGDVNIRARWCQSVAPPSVHPSGRLYRFVQDGPIARAHDLNEMIGYLVKLDPTQKAVTPRRAAGTPSQTGGAQDIKRYFPSVLDVFKSHGFTDAQTEQNGEIRIHDHGGLLVDEANGRWYCFRDEMGGDVLDAWGFAVFGSAWDRWNKAQFLQVVKEMREAAGIGETRQELPRQNPKRFHVWGKQLSSSYWGTK